MASSSNAPSSADTTTATTATSAVDHYSRSAILFSSSLLQCLEGRQRLPSTYIGVRRVRDVDESSSSSRTTIISQRSLPMRQDEDVTTTTVVAVDSNVHDDQEWVPTELTSSSSPSSPFIWHDSDHQKKEKKETMMEKEKTTTTKKVAPIVFRITDPGGGDGTTTAATTIMGRRMTSREKKQVKKQWKEAQHAIRREERQRLHEQRIQEAKKQKEERKRLKRLAWQLKKMQQSEQQQSQPQQQQQQQQEKEEQQQQPTQPMDIRHHQQPQQNEKEKSKIYNPLDERFSIATTCSNRSRSSSVLNVKAPSDQSQKLVEERDHDPIPMEDTPRQCGASTRCVPSLPPTPAMLTPAAATYFATHDMGLAIIPHHYEQHTDRSSSSTIPTLFTTTSKPFLPKRSTILDPVLSAQWAKQLLHDAFIPADMSRAKEEMRPMAYRVVPEVWSRLCPDSLWNAVAALKTTNDDDDDDDDDAAHFTSTDSHDGKGNTNINKKEKNHIFESREGAVTTTDLIMPSTTALTTTTATTLCYSPCHDYAFAPLRSNPCSSYDEDAYLIFKHLHEYSNLHIACGALFGCDFLLYDGHRDKRHSFAGLRIYCCETSRCRSGGEKEEEEEGGSTSNHCVDRNYHFPIPSAYDMAGFVRTMNSARKIALLATVIRVEDGQNGDNCGGDGNDNSPSTTVASTFSYRIAIVDLALEKVLTAPTHVRKGNTNKRRSEEDTAIGLAKRKM